MAVKIIFFATPATLVYEDKWEIDKAAETRQFMLGDWKGDMQKGNRSAELIKSEVLVSVDENSISFTGLSDLTDEYQLFLYGMEDGSLVSFESFDQLALRVKHVSVDSLSFILIEEEQRFQFSLDRIIE